MEEVRERLASSAKPHGVALEMQESPPGVYALVREVPAAATDATGSELVDQRHLCAMHLCETVPEPTLRRRGVAESC